MSRKTQDTKTKAMKRNADSVRPARGRTDNTSTAKKSSSTKRTDAYNPVRALQAKNGRFYFLAFVLVILACVSMWRVASHQVLAGDQGFEFLQAQGDARSLRTETITAHRGVITDRHGEPLAVSTPVVSVWAEPKFLLGESDKWPALAVALGMSEQELRERIGRYANKEFVYLRRHLSPA
ncbi:MAG: hypothetical protein KDI30_02675, partial [Pseudomonadales bacterium]|nr:hypothetical protein [Pseudomonadales bacterium]